MKGIREDVSFNMGLAQLSERAKEIFGTDAISAFDEIDPFNRGNHVVGWLCRADGKFYGSLLIWTVNGAEAVQLIRCTPKIGYPFDRNRQWVFPSAMKINAYEKLDGTNILQYQYFDANGFRFVTYKTRLLPFLRDGGRWGDFKSMWDRMLEKYASIPTLVQANGCNVSYELYGSANPHLILYSVPLDTVVLFGVTNGGNIIDPEDLKLGAIPQAALKAKIDGQYVESYQWQKAQMQSELAVVVAGETYRGLEGQVWYMHLEDGRVVQYKCKPDEIESIHFSQGRKLSKTTVITTCLNALENTDAITYDFVVELLAEEYSHELISLSTDMILECIKKVQRDLEFKQSVVVEYQMFIQGSGLSILTDKRATMRAMSMVFSKSEITQVYNVLTTYETVGRRS